MKEINIAEILKDCPKGTELYSPLYGAVLFDEYNKYNGLIFVTIPDKPGAAFTSTGQPNAFRGAECMLFPSKDNRDWSTFKAPKHFGPFQKVLIKIPSDNTTKGCLWKADLYSHYNLGYYHTVGGYIKEDGSIIPYSGNEHLLGKEVKQ